jgi:glycosyltransferase involved in cell wall biosynthesis
VLSRMRRADLQAARRAHIYIANSRFIQRRIKDVYGRRSVLINPPIELSRFRIDDRVEDNYLMVGRLLPHRNMHLTVEAFTRMGRRLIVVGDGPIRADLERIAGPTIEFAGAVDNATLETLYARSRGVVVAGEEDFGMVPLEANASGRPVVALARGGALETVRDGVTGVLFKDETADAIAEAVKLADGTLFDAYALRRHAEQFGEDAFAEKMNKVVEGTVDCLECARTRAAG